ncbi:MAG TPA: DUF881 domain-containing protein [Acidimicrobiales bacterium]|nr:DUF881 domain-containing protein [Acidimicrobiales bacterium]
MRRPSLALATVLAVLGFLLVTAVSTARASKRVEAPRKTQLIKLIENRRSSVDDLDQAVKQLQKQVAAAQTRANRRSRSDASAAAKLAQLSLAAGTTAVEGRGLVVRLADSDRQPPAGDDDGAYRIHDSDVQLVINALFAAGAEAVSVNGSRIVATTPIRSAGDTIVVNFRPVTPPYSVVAIGANAEQFGASEIAGRFHRWVSLFGLGFSVRQEGRVSVPAFTGRVAITYADPAEQSTAPAPTPAPGGGR